MLRQIVLHTFQVCSVVHPHPTATLSGRNHPRAPAALLPVDLPAPEGGSTDGWTEDGCKRYFKNVLAYTRDRERERERIPTLRNAFHQRNVQMNKCGCSEVRARGE